ncbi:MAG: hypothetical protein ACK57K_02610 [Chryseotalea sp.]
MAAFFCNLYFLIFVEKDSIFNADDFLSELTHVVSIRFDKVFPDKGIIII